MEIGGSTALVTGATGGLGQAIARELSRQGAELVLSGRQQEVLDSLAGELGARAIRCDLAEPGAAEELASEAGDIDILVANAGVQGVGRLESFEVSQIDETLDINLRAPIVLSRLFLDGMMSRARGHLVFISSMNGKVPTPRASMYNATKYGLRGFALALRADLHASGVGVSVICPGFISEAGMYAKSNVDLPAGVGTRRPKHVADAVASAIRHDRAEVDVAPLPVRLGGALAGHAPDLFAKATRLMGGERVAERMDAAAHAASEPQNSRG
jgi:short-subunit dehydrogenase